MSLSEFIRKHEKEIDDTINHVTYRYDGNGGRGIIPIPAPNYTYEERRLWVLNDESLYNFARSKGVGI